MDKLAPVIKYHFWILLVIAFIMAFTGWWMTTAQMQGAIVTRKGAIKKAEDTINGVNSAEVPSKDWEEKLKAINANQEKLNRVSRDWLYAKQKERMVWPDVLKEVAAKMRYREDFKDAIHHINFRDNYTAEVERVYRIPKPIELLGNSGVVMFPLTAMPHREWGDVTPTSQQMWDSIEDLWLLEPILQAILETNGGESGTRFDAAVVAIEYLKLKGGDRSKIGQSSEPAGGGGGGGGGGGAAGGPAGMPAASGGFGPGGDTKGSGGSTIPGLTTSVDFKEADELGDPGDAGGGGSPPGGPGGPAMPDAKTSGFSGSGRSSEDAGRRYIDDEKSGLPYRTRGFKLTVIMNHRYVPDLYAQLTSSERSPWPIQILRMHVGRLHDSGGAEAGVPGGMGGAAGGLGMPAGGGGLAGGFGGLGSAAGRDDGDAFGIPGNAGGQAAGSMDHLRNPMLARVTIVGLITLYNEPEKVEEPAAPANPSTDAQPGAQPAAPPGESAEPNGEEGEMAAADDEEKAKAADGAEAEPAMEAEEEGEMKAEEKDVSDETADEDTPAKKSKPAKKSADAPEAEKSAEQK